MSLQQRPDTHANECAEIVGVEVVTEGDDRFPCESVSFGPLESRLIVPEGQRLSVGDSVRIRLELSDGEDVPLLNARVIERIEEDCRSVHGLRHHLDDEFMGLLSPAARHLFNVRRFKRRRMSRPVVAQLWGEDAGTLTAGTITDVSAEGVGLMVPPEAEEQFDGTERVAVSFRLDPASEPFRFEATIRRRRLLVRGLLYGLRFESWPQDYEDEAERLERCLDELGIV